MWQLTTETTNQLPSRRACGYSLSLSLSLYKQNPPHEATIHHITQASSFTPKSLLVSFASPIHNGNKNCHIVLNVLLNSSHIYRGLKVPVPKTQRNQHDVLHARLGDRMKKSERNLNIIGRISMIRKMITRRVSDKYIMLCLYTQ